jgi:hypothetical protein
VLWCVWEWTYTGIGGGWRASLSVLGEAGIASDVGVAATATAAAAAAAKTVGVEPYLADALGALRRIALRTPHDALAYQAVRALGDAGHALALRFAANPAAACALLSRSAENSANPLSPSVTEHQQPTVGP